ncbi:hypothetical protein RB653_002889 [Dictyostelium firmibasis]|uniref:Phospholipase B-like n=1 Tax=Dictyostelium firmibasis TaxID=79012 RepID=A0AAN7YT44_9MYCE
MKIIRSLLLLTIAIIGSVLSNGVDDGYTVFYAQPDNYYVKPGTFSNGVAQAIFSNEMMSTGWSFMSISSSEGLYPNEIIAAGAGYLEGYISQETIYQNWMNMYQNEYHNVIGSDVEDWIQENVQYLEDMIESAPSTDLYWQNIQTLLTQITYMQRGYNQSIIDNDVDSSQLLGLTEFFLMNMDGDMIDLGPALNLTNGKQVTSPATATSPKQAFKEFMRRTGHCSALIKLTDDLSDLFSGHTTWSSYYEMVRMFKVYNLKYLFNGQPPASKVTMFSGYPGTLSSIDDFYLLDTKIVVIETTNGLMNNNLYHLITSQSVLSWMRVIVANRLATSGESWCQAFSLYNSGTYNNQWIVVDYNKFIKGYGALDGTLYILEQVPDYIEYGDQTPILRTGFWPSFNIPFYENIYGLTGFNETYAQFGNWFSYQASPRSMIFKRDANNIHSLTQFQAMLRYNNWQNDPFSQGNAGNQISSRFDLVTSEDPNNQYLDPDAFGGIDSKVVSADMVAALLVNAQSGPSHDNETPFTWNSQWAEKYTYAGQPTTWNFDWMTMSLQSMKPATTSSSASSSDSTTFN